MEQFYILDKLNTRVEMKQVLQWLDCAEDSPVYDDFVEEYQAMEQQIDSLIKPRGILGFGRLSQAVATVEYPVGTEVLYAVTTVGRGASEASTKAFNQGNYVQGMLWDAIADAALFSLEEDLQKNVREVCSIHNVGIVKRLEAPQDIPMEVQREAWETLQLEERLGMDISSGFMLDPVKSSCQVFILTADTTVFKAQHDCRNCTNVTCKMRTIPQVEVTVRTKDGISKIHLKPDESLMDGLLREGFYISALCGGKGRCGKCKVKVLSGKAAVSSEDEKFFTKSKLDEGWRLSCMQYPNEDLEISINLNDESEFEAVSGFELPMEKLSNRKLRNAEGYTVAIDIGTTTIAFQLLDESGSVLGTETIINGQRKYGADVVTRIQAAVDGKEKELQESIRRDLQKGIMSLLSGCDRSLEQIRCISIACNTTMSHLLMGYDCTSLGAYPYTPVNIAPIYGTIEDIIGLQSEAEVAILPGISTYVGGDIVSGLYACDFHRSDEVCLLVDLGTNGEMALGNREKLLVTSTAAGPAFEGGNLTWGMGSVAGAICSVSIPDSCVKPDSEPEKQWRIQLKNGQEIHIETIRNQSAVGICGTGVVEAIAEMLRVGILNETGLLDEDYFDDGFPLTKTESGEIIVLTQKDIRELQLAKAAVRAGIETLLLRYGITKEQVSKVYLAGGFGYRLDVEKAIAIGMLPEEFSGKVEAVGNTALAGAVEYLGMEQAEETLQKIVNISEEIGLAEDEDFNDFYMEYIMFE